MSTWPRSEGYGFYKMLHTHDHQELVKRMTKHMTGGEIEFILTWAVQVAHREKYPLVGDRTEARGDRLPFSGDIEDGPPLAWVISWRGRHSNGYGDIIPEALEAWGYMFWDTKRLLKTKGKEILGRTLEAERRDVAKAFEERVGVSERDSQSCFAWRTCGLNLSSAVQGTSGVLFPSSIKATRVVANRASGGRAGKLRRVTRLALTLSLTTHNASHRHSRQACTARAIRGVDATTE